MLEARALSALLDLGERPSLIGLEAALGTCEPPIRAYAPDPDNLESALDYDLIITEPSRAGQYEGATLLIVLSEGEPEIRRPGALYAAGLRDAASVAAFASGAVAARLGPGGCLLDGERRYADLVHALPDVVYELDEEGRFTFLNDSVSVLGYEPADLIGRRFTEILHEEDADAVDRDKVLMQYKGVRTGDALKPKLFNERRGVERRTENLEIRIKRKARREGEAKDIIGAVLSYGEVSAAGEYRRREGGLEFMGSVGVIRDITLRLKSEETLRKLYQAVDQIEMGILIADASYEVEYANPAFFKMSGHGPAETIGQGLFSLFDFSPEREEEARALSSDGYEIREDLRLKGEGGAGRWTGFHLSPVMTPSGDAGHFVAIASDITKKRAAEELLKGAKEAAERADRAKGEFLANMGHELRGPATAIVSAARLIQMGDPDPVARATRIVQDAERLLSTMGDILDYVRFESGRARLEPLHVPLGAMIERCAASFKPRARDKGLGLELSIVDRDAVLSLDPTLLERAVSALLDNAIKFTDKGEVKLSARLEGKPGDLPYLVVTIGDTGPGIPASEEERAFSPLVQLASPFDKSAGGTGMGLPLARAIVHAMGGELRAGMNPGGGSLFSILVPAGVPEEEDGDRAAVLGSLTEPLLLLVVDDNEVNLEYMKVVLENAGHRVRTAATGAAALQELELHPFDGLVVDVQMPHMSGIELSERIRAYEGARYSPDIPVLALTAYSPNEEAFGRARFDAVFQKPADVKRLLGAISEAIAGSDDGECPVRTEILPGSDAFGKVLAKAMAHIGRAHRALSDGRRADFRKEVRQAEASLGSIGAKAAAGLLRRVALYAATEEPPVLASLIARVEAAVKAAIPRLEGSAGRGAERRKGT